MKKQWNPKRQQYSQVAKKTHKPGSESGRILVVADQVYVGASPDILVRCDCCGELVLAIKYPISVTEP